MTGEIDPQVTESSMQIAVSGALESYELARASTDEGWVLTVRLSDVTGG